MSRAVLVVMLSCAGATGIAAASSSPAAPPVARTSAAEPAAPVRTARARTSCPVPVRWRAAFRTAAEDSRLPVSLLAAVAYVESRFHHEAISPRGAVGLLQVLPSTAAVLRLDASRPETNVLAGARFLRAMLDRFRSSDLALAAYNAGPAAVERAGGAPSGETLRYVLDVNARWRATVGCTA